MIYIYLVISCFLVPRGSLHISTASKLQTFVQGRLTPHFYLKKMCRSQTCVPESPGIIVSGLFQQTRLRNIYVYTPMGVHIHMSHSYLCICSFTSIFKSVNSFWSYSSHHRILLFFTLTSFLVIRV